MKKERGASAWLLRGRLRSTVVHVLERPMSIEEIWAAASSQIYGLCRSAVRRALRNLTTRHLVYVLTPHVRDGRLYWLTAHGRRTLSTIWGPDIHGELENLDWESYARIRANSLMTNILVAMKKHRRFGPMQAKRIAALASNKCYIELERVCAAMPALISMGVIQVVGKNVRRERMLYWLTEKGEEIADRLQEDGRNKIAELL